MSLLKAAATVSSLTLISRITGVIRDMLIARFFGASVATDAFYVAFRLPNMLRRLFAEGAFQQAFVPMLSDVKANQSEAEVRTFIDRVFSLLATVVLLVSILGVLAASVASPAARFSNAVSKCCTNCADSVIVFPANGLISPSSRDIRK